MLCSIRWMVCIVHIVSQKWHFRRLGKKCKEKIHTASHLDLLPDSATGALGTLRFITSFEGVTFYMFFSSVSPVMWNKKTNAWIVLANLLSPLKFHVLPLFYFFFPVSLSVNRMQMLQISCAAWLIPLHWLECHRGQSHSDRANLTLVSQHFGYVFVAAKVVAGWVNNYA